MSTRLNVLAHGMTEYREELRINILILLVLKSVCTNYFRKLFFVLELHLIVLSYEPSRLFFFIDGFCTEVIIKSVCMQPPSESYCVLFPHLLYLVFMFLYKSSSVFLI